jgi:hypothetical protein
MQDSGDIWGEEGILLLSDEDLEKKYPLTSVEGAMITCLKHIRRYGTQVLPKEIWVKILYYALKGYHCKDKHLCTSQRSALVEYLKDKEISDPYIKQFLKEFGGEDGTHQDSNPNCNRD